MLRRTGIVYIVFWLLTASGTARADADGNEFFEKTIRPLLANHCFSCHGTEKQKAGLRLDSRDAVMTGGESGPAMTPGRPKDSLIVRAISYDHDTKMPPKGKLNSNEIAALTRWIKEGAPWPKYKDEIGKTKDATKVEPASSFVLDAKSFEFWSFRPLGNSSLPAVRDAAWPKTPIDYFVLAKHEASQVHSIGPADKRTLIRRATFDLIGLPPSVAEIDSFLRDESPEAFSRVVERLLASPHYGERWARHWLDVARYGEDQAHTFQARQYPNGYRYRDWLVRAFNSDLPYDRFIKEQIAADLLGDPNTPERLAALGFFALGPVYYGDAKKLDQYDDRIDTLTRGFLGLTVACARCHDHKFDPIPTKDYYALAGIVASTDYEEVPLVPAAEVELAKQKQSAEEKKRKAPLKIPLVHSVKEAAKPQTMRVHVRGNPETLAEEAPHRFLSILDRDGKPFTKGSGRLELAEAIARADNPLTARVMVNRIWQHHFGRGIVGTPSNFGALGERPTHPELLDYLARRFIASGWSIKALHREIMLSATYQLGSQPDAANAAVDADNKLIWRMNRRRLDVESWRDAMLAAAGSLDRTLGGPSHDLNSPDNRRRTFYARVSRHELNSLLRLFDFPDPNITSAARTVTTVPLQQLFVLNSEFMVRNAQALTTRLASAADNNPERIRQAYALLYGRPTTEREMHMGLSFLARAEPAGGSALSRWQQYAQALLSANEFMFVD